MPGREANRYEQLIEHVFFDPPFGHRPGAAEVPFKREQLESAAVALGLKLPKNIGDILYAFRYRVPLPARILGTQPDGMEWVIEAQGRAQYRFALVPISRITPNPALVTIDIPDATPDIIGMYLLDDEQALLARVRYNRLIDTFLQVTAYSLQSHMRTHVKGTGQIEIDEVYVALDREGTHAVVPVQAKGGRDQLSVVQTKQDLAWAAAQFPGLACRAVSAQFMEGERIAMFELAMQDGSLRVVQERHYRLSPGEPVTPAGRRRDRPPGRRPGQG